VPLTGTTTASTPPGILRAFDAADVSRELWDSQQNAARDAVGKVAKFTPPTIANGKVYLATRSGYLDVYGLLPTTTSGATATPTATATPGTTPPAAATPTATTTSAPSTGDDPLPAPNTPTSPPTNAPTVTLTNTPTSASSTMPTATPTTTPSRAPTTRAAATPTVGRSHPAPLPLILHVAPHAAAGGQVLTVGVRTVSRARVTLTLRVLERRVVFRGKGKQRKRLVQQVSLYTVQAQGTANGKGRFTRALKITYQPRKPVQALLAASARMGRRIATRTTQVTILPHRHQQTTHQR
jgi:hypothetical protein